MDYGFKQTLLSRCILSGLLAGFAAVLANFAFNYIYREVSGFTLSEVVNVVSIIFSSILVTLVGGVLLYIFLKMKNGRTVYMILFLLLTVAGIFAASQTERSNVPANQHEFRILFAGIIIIDGLCAAFLVPYFTNHQKLYS